MADPVKLTKISVTDSSWARDGTRVRVGMEQTRRSWRVGRTSSTCCSQSETEKKKGDFQELDANSVAMIQGITETTVDSGVAQSVTKSKKTARLLAAKRSAMRVEGARRKEVVHEVLRCGCQKSTGVSQCNRGQGKQCRVWTAGVIHRR